MEQGLVLFSATRNNESNALGLPLAESYFRDLQGATVMFPCAKGLKLKKR